MNIKIIDRPIKEIRKSISKIYKIKEKNEIDRLELKTIEMIKSILSDRQINEMLSELKDYKFIDEISYEGLAKVEEATRVLSDKMAELKRQVELEDFFKKGYNLNIMELKKRYKKKRLDREFPDLDFEKISNLYVYPPKELPTYYNQNLMIKIDPYVWRKYMIALLQMIFNHMDFVVCNVGDEGAGKSCKCSQDMFIVWWIMKEIKIIDYKFDINEIFANTLRKFAELEDKYYGVPFRIIGLDEGNELNRQDWKEDDVKLFWQRLRRERHERRIKFINIPVLGEMIINIVLSRINFIFNMINKNESKTGTLYKGDYDFYIIPRGDKIYSPISNRELSKEEIKNKLYINLKDKGYLKGLPKEIRVKRCFCNGVWGFQEKDYIKSMKETNRQYAVTRGIKFGPSELFSLYKCKLTPNRVGISRQDVLYPSFNKLVRKITQFWNNNPEMVAKYDNIFKQKKEFKEKNGRVIAKPIGKHTPT